jgi:hypothetical protein
MRRAGIWMGWVLAGCAHTSPPSLARVDEGESGQAPAVRVSGVVTDEAGEPLEGAEIGACDTLQARDDVAWSVTTSASSVAAAVASRRFGDCVATRTDRFGSWTLVFRPLARMDFVPLIVTARDRVVHKDHLSLMPGQPDVVLERASSLVVTYDCVGRPCSRPAAVRLGKRAVVFAEGRAEFHHLPAASEEVRIRLDRGLPGELAARQSVARFPGTADSVHLSLRPTGTGRVVQDRIPAPAPGRVWIDCGRHVDPNEPFVGEDPNLPPAVSRDTTAAADGTFTIPDIGPDPCEVTVSWFEEGAQCTAVAWVIPGSSISWPGKRCKSMARGPFVNYATQR